MWNGSIRQHEAPTGLRRRRLQSRGPGCHDVARPRRGFTLLEMLITLAIISVLTAIALPSYRGYVLRANRAQAKQFMGDIANREEQYLLDQRNYTTTIGAGGLATTPPSETSGNYTFAVSIAPGKDCLGVALPPLGYTIAATAVGGQVGDGNLCLDSLNQKTPIAKWDK
jgi:type IV pilus assembly protein PilE